jgi:hypothetical protein
MGSVWQNHRGQTAAEESCEGYMVNKSLLLFACLIAFPILAIAKETQNVIELMIIHNGKRINPPDQIEFNVDRKSFGVPVREGRFEVPIEITFARKILFVADIDGCHIKTSIGTPLHDAVKLLITFDDNSYGEGLDKEFLKGTDIRKTCFIGWIEPKSEGMRHGEELNWVQFQPNCRSANKKK